MRLKDIYFLINPQARRTATICLLINGSNKTYIRIDDRSRNNNDKDVMTKWGDYEIEEITTDMYANTIQINLK